jgi:peptidoglycan L-alanyl-D-glutamate endopeptidase CwlK
MPQVPGEPYEPYPEVMPAERVLRPLEARTIPDAFGVGVGQVLHAAGAEGQAAAERLFQTGLSLRKMDIERITRDALTGLSNKVAPVQQDFLTREGLNADGNALQAHLIQMQQMHDEARANLEKQGVGDYGLDKFDNEWSSYQRTFTREGIGWSARQVRDANDKSMDSSTAARLDAIGNDPSGTLFEKWTTPDPATGRAPITDDATDKAAFKGFDQTWADRYEGQIKSKAILSRIKSLTQTGDYAGARQFADLHEKEILGEEDRARSEAYVNNAEDKYLAPSAARAQAQGFASYMSGKEIGRTNGVSTPLIETFKRAQQLAARDGVEITIGDEGGRRTVAEQARLVAAGRSKTMNSGHLDGSAMDVVGRVDGRPAYDDRKLQDRVDGYMRQAAQELNVDLRDQISWDKYHFQLAADYNRAGFVKPPLPSLEAQKDANVRYVTSVSPNNPGLQAAAISSTDQEYRIKRLSEQDQFDQAKITFETGVDSGLYRVPADVPPDLMRQFTDGAGAAGAAYAAAIPHAIKVHADNDEGSSPEREANEYRILGMLKGIDLETQKNAARMNLYAVDLEPRVRKQLQKYQSEVISGTARDPTRLASVMTSLVPMLMSAGIDRQSPDPKTQDKYLSFQGQVYKKLEEMVLAGENVPTNPKQLTDLFQPILKSMSLQQDLKTAAATTTPKYPTVASQAEYQALEPGKPFMAIDPRTGRLQQFTKPYIPPGVSAPSVASE